MSRSFPNHSTLVSEPRIAHLERVVRTICEENIPGDLIETGCWRGGACVVMREVLEECGDETRVVYACDSFEGHPKPDLAQFPLDSYSNHYKQQHLAVTEDECREVFQASGFLDDRTKIVKGWFKDTLPGLEPPSGSWSLLRLDGNLYESTAQALEALYEKLSPRGFVIIDDYSFDPGARSCTHDFLTTLPQSVELLVLEESAYWRKP